MGSRCWEILKKMSRTKTLDKETLDTPLDRCLNLLDLVFLGVGHMVGSGIYVITGTVAKEIAGPAVVLSFLLAGVAALLSSLCYAELGSKVPKAGSAYTYTYVTIGEFLAFVIGWSMILESLIGSASVARAWSGYFDSLFQGSIHNGTLEYIGSMNVPWLSHYPDFIAFLAVVVATVFVALGAKASTTFNNVLTVISLSILCFIIVLGIYFADVDANWIDVPGGFLPYGFTGVLAGAGSCFYAYIGFEGIATAGEEAKNPARTIPISTGLAMAIVSILYFGSSAVLTLMVPYDAIDVTAPFPVAFDRNQCEWAKYLVAIGAIVGMSTSLLGSIYCLPRAVYSMASDGLFFRCFAVVNSRTQTPLLSVFVFGLASGTIAFFVDIEVLVELMSIGTILSFTVVSACVLLLRYQPPGGDGAAPSRRQPIEPPASHQHASSAVSPPFSSVEQNAVLTSENGDGGGYCQLDDQQLITDDDDLNVGKPRKTFSRCLPCLARLPAGYACRTAVAVLTLSIVVVLSVLLHAMAYVASAAWWAIMILIVFGLGFISSFGILCVHQQNVKSATFQVPLVPLLPALSMIMNIGMMLQLNHQTWIRLLVWILIGILIYFCYGMRHSTENERPLPNESTALQYYSKDQGNLMTRSTRTQDSDHNPS